MIRPKESLLSTLDHIVNYAGGKYYPYFKDCVGALDGTHIHALPPPERQLTFRSGRGPKYYTQNVLGVYDFHMRFTFVLAR